MQKLVSATIELDQHFSPNLLKQVEAVFKENNGETLLRIVQAIVLARRGEYFDKKDPYLKIKLETERSVIRVTLTGLPEEKLINGRLIRIKEDQILAGIRDLLFARLQKNELPLGEETTETVFSFVRNAGLLDKKDLRKNAYGRVMIQGGHHIPELETRHHKRVGYAMGTLGLEMITGSGPGAMEAPMKGALRGYQMNGHRNRKFIGITEDGIIAGEPCNDYISDLIVFPDIEKRLEAFVRMSRSGIIFPGGIGTFEEILTILWIKTHPQNKDLRFPLYFSQPVQSGNYFNHIIEFLEVAFQKDFLKEGLFRYYESNAEDKSDPNFDPKRVALDLQSEMRENTDYYLRQGKGDPAFMLFNWDLYFPEQLQMPLKINREFVESLTFSNALPIEELFFSLRSLSSAIVETNVRDREYLSKYGPFQLKGDPEMLNAMDKLFERFAAEGRMGGREYLCPYEIKKN